MIKSLANHLYEERLKRLGSFILERKEIRGERRRVYKITNEIEKVDWEFLFFLFYNTTTRGNPANSKLSEEITFNTQVIRFQVTEAKSIARRGTSYLYRYISGHPIVHHNKV